MHGFVTGSYWAEGVPRDVVERSVANSLTLRAHPDLAGIRRFILATADAHQVYADCGFTPISDPSVYMEITRPAREL